MDMVEAELEEGDLDQQLETFKKLRGLNGDDLEVKVSDMQPVLPGF
jgi:hypothetical protein